MRTEFKRHHPLHIKVLLALLVLYTVFIFLPTIGIIQANALKVPTQQQGFEDQVKPLFEPTGGKNLYISYYVNSNITAHKSTASGKANTSTSKVAYNIPKAGIVDNKDKAVVTTPNKGAENTTSTTNGTGNKPQASVTCSGRITTPGKAAGNSAAGPSVSGGLLNTADKTAGSGTQPSVKKTSVTVQQPKTNTKIAYLTFDDGPTPATTPQILDILSRYKIKATFFVLGGLAESNPALLKREKDEGHFIGNHTYSHIYRAIYANSGSLLNELHKTDAILTSILGNDFSTRVIRFPGGSFGDKLKPFRDAVTKAGYSYVDWNALNGDSEALNVPEDKLYSNIVNTTAGKNEAIILMHDSPGKETTVKALPRILDYLKSQGFTFETLENYGSPK